MANARVEIHDEVEDGRANTWRLCFHRVTYHYEDGSTEDGYLFVWRRSDNTLQGARGRARIPDRAALNRLITAAKVPGRF
jgi:hypothetical protein